MRRRVHRDVDSIYAAWIERGADWFEETYPNIEGCAIYVASRRAKAEKIRAGADPTTLMAEWEIRCAERGDGP